MKNTLVLALALFLLACQGDQEAPTYTAFTGATIIDGSGAAPIQDGVLLINDGHVVQAGSKADVKIPEGATTTDVSGKFIIPGLINAHGHVGETKGIEGGHYSRENILDNLSIYARYGVTSVVSLGGDKKEAVPLRAVNDTTGGHARLYISGDPIRGNPPLAEALARVDSNHRMGVDWIKIGVDDNLGTAPKMDEATYRALIARSHELGYKVAAHMYYLDDATRLLAAGSDLMAHSVRDKPVDAGFIALIKEKKVCYCPTLTRELSTYVYADTAEFFSDPFFKKEFDSLTIQPLLDPVRQQQVAGGNGPKVYRKQLPTVMANLKTLSDNGVTIAFGTDSGVPTRFMGYFEHIELAMMAEAGMTPMQIIRSATKDAAECMGLKNLGTLETGHWADFIVLDADPLADIRNSRKINRVFIGGVEVKRD